MWPVKAAEVVSSGTRDLRRAITLYVKVLDRNFFSKVVSSTSVLQRSCCDNQAC